MTKSSDYESAMLEAFIGKPEKTEYYRNTFAKYSVNGVDRIMWNWNYWAAFGGIFFFLYRKLYIEAGVIFLINLAAASTLSIIGWTIIGILMGGYGSYFVYKRYNKVKLNIENSTADETKRIGAMRVYGGVNQWVIWAGAAASILTLIGILISGMFISGVFSGLSNG